MQLYYDPHPHHARSGHAAAGRREEGAAAMVDDGGRRGGHDTAQSTVGEGGSGEFTISPGAPKLYWHYVRGSV
jgi:hypothetical protein